MHISSPTILAVPSRKTVPTAPLTKGLNKYILLWGRKHTRLFPAVGRYANVNLLESHSFIHDSAVFTKLVTNLYAYPARSTIYTKRSCSLRLFEGCRTTRVRSTLPVLMGTIVYTFRQGSLHWWRTRGEQERNFHSSNEYRVVLSTPVYPHERTKRPQRCFTMWRICEASIVCFIKPSPHPRSSPSCRLYAT